MVFWVVHCQMNGWRCKFDEWQLKEWRLRLRIVRVAFWISCQNQKKRLRRKLKRKVKNAVKIKWNCLIEIFFQKKLYTKISSTILEPFYSSICGHRLSLCCFVLLWICWHYVTTQMFFLQTHLNYWQNLSRSVYVNLFKINILITLI